MNTPGNSVNQTIQSSQTMTSRVSRPDQHEMGLPRMSDEDYCSEFGGTPRPGSDRQQIAEATCKWLFSQMAKERARETKRKVRTRTEYRMGANAKVIQAFNTLNATLEAERQNPAVASEVMSEVMSDADFQLLKQGITNFRVRVKVHDNITLDELRQMRIACDIRKNTMANSLSSDEVADLNYWSNALVEETRRLSFNVMRPCQHPPTVPSHHAHIMPSSGEALRNILTPETIRRRFISIDALAKTISTELVNFLTAPYRASDRKAVVEQIKESCRSRR